MAYLRLRCRREEAMARYGRWIGLAEVEQPRLVKERDSFTLAQADDQWRGFAVFVFVYGPWTVFDFLSSTLAGRSVESWLELAQNDDLVYVDSDEDLPYAELLVIRQGRLVRHLVADEDDASKNVNIGKLPEESRKQFRDWADVLGWADTDSQKIVRLSHGWLWIHEANWPNEAS